MYSMFDLFFDTPAYRQVYVISDSEMRELHKTQQEEELNEIIHQKERLEKAYKAQMEHIHDREKDLRTKLKAFKPSNKKV